jgi:Rod binding domain-containing protein
VSDPGPLRADASLSREIGRLDTLDALRSGRITDPKRRLEAAASLLEASFYQELFKALRDTVPEGELTGGGDGEDIFSSLMDQHIAEVAAMRSERGLGRAVYRHFTAGAAGAGAVPESAASTAHPDTLASAAIPDTVASPFLRGTAGSTPYPEEDRSP